LTIYNLRGNPYLRLVKKLKTFIRYLSFYRQAVTKHEIHSPFVYSLITEVLEDKSHDAAYDLIESIKAQNLDSDKTIETIDLGAGSHFSGEKKRKIADIARHASKSQKLGRLLFRLSKHFKGTELLEIGTSLGFSTLYIHAGNKDASLTTLEGCPQTAAAALINFKAFGSNKIVLKEGPFEESLPALLEKKQKLDFVFFDGNHRKEPTLDYFRSCLAKAQANSVFIFDDIHWSEEMEEAWDEIQQHGLSTVTIDLFFMGLVFFRPGQVKQHFKVRF
jgi:predicted O-methyltransferase YrrM